MVKKDTKDSRELLMKLMLPILVQSKQVEEHLQRWRIESQPQQDSISVSGTGDVEPKMQGTELGDRK